MNKRLLGLTAAILIGIAWSGLGAEIVLRDDFSTNAPGNDVPAGWRLYRQGPTLGGISVEPSGNAMRLHLKDVCDKSEIGITRILPAVRGKYYRLTATAVPAAGTTRNSSKSSVALQLRFLSNPPLIKQVWMADNREAVAAAQANADRLQIYIYTMKPGQPDVFIPEVRLEVSDTPFK